MNSKVLKTLEYNKIIEKLTALASSSMAKEKCEKLVPLSDIDEIKLMQKNTSDALSRIFQKGSVSFSGLKDVRASVKRLEIGSILSMAELLAISSVLDVTNRVKAFSRQENDEIEKDSLDDMFEVLAPLTPVNNEIKRCIISDEEMSDDASPTLKSIRRAMRNANEKIRAELTSIVSSQTQRTYLQEYVVTQRNGRYCIPVKSEYKSQVPGMIHDQSQTGSTIFIEPMSVVKLNNELKELEIKEHDEIEVILGRLTNEIAAYAEDITKNVTTLTDLDFIFAKAGLSKLMKASEPSINEDGYINIKKGRHPLIDPKKVVPIDVYLGDEFTSLIITGPNTGGKTVSLKTVGLLSLMGQAGLHIPAFDGSCISVFEEIYADIGDEQSIEQSLSTFSSHMTNIVKILDKANYRSLVLFDELCAGTDPTEGAALATAILTSLHKSEVRVMATTHYSELKVYALTTDGVCNACCEFNVETLSPTYRLLIGIPGKSNAFAISSKLNLPSYIIDNAKKLLNSQDEAFEDLLSELETNRVKIEKEKAEIEAYKAEIETLKKELESKNEQIAAKKEAILRNANEKANEILTEAKDYADETIKKFNKYAKTAPELRDMERDREKLRGKLGKVQNHLAIKNTQAPKKLHKPEDFKLGDKVKVLSLNLEGTISSKPNAKGEVFVQMGILRSQVNIKDLEIIDEPVVTGPNMSKTGQGKIKMSKSFSISPEINLIGNTVDDALAILDKYLDDAYLSHLPKVRVVHGKGTGALRNAVHQHLKRQKNVKSYHLGTFGEGDAGVTIVEFK